MTDYPQSETGSLQKLERKTELNFGNDFLVLYFRFNGKIIERTTRFIQDIQVLEKDVQIVVKQCNDTRKMRLAACRHTIFNFGLIF